MSKSRLMPFLHFSYVTQPNIISKQRTAGQEKLPGLGSHSHLTAEQTMTRREGIADTSPCMCKNKAAPGRTLVCLRQSWKLRWPRHEGVHSKQRRLIAMCACHVLVGDFCVILCLESLRGAALIVFDADRISMENVFHQHRRSLMSALVITQINCILPWDKVIHCV